MEQNQSINLSLPLPQGTQSTGEPGGGGGGELVLRGSIVEKKQGGWGHFISFLWDLDNRRKLFNQSARILGVLNYLGTSMGLSAGLELSQQRFLERLARLIRRSRGLTGSVIILLPRNLYLTVRIIKQMWPEYIQWIHFISNREYLANNPEYRVANNNCQGVCYSVLSHHLLGFYEICLQLVGFQC